MTEKEKQLLLKDLCARLPYGVQLQMFAKEFDGKVYEHPCELDTEILQIMIDNEDIVYLPYLRPMSSMTEEEKTEWGGVYAKSSAMSFGEFLSNTSDWLNEHHFDYRGLIPMGLAIEAPKGMYKI